MLIRWKSKDKSQSSSGSSKKKRKGREGGNGFYLHMNIIYFCTFKYFISMIFIICFQKIQCLSQSQTVL